MRLANEVGFSREGKVNSVDNQMDTGSGTIRVRAIFDNTDYSLVPGLYARIEVGGGAPHAAVLVQAAAVGTDQDKTFVLVVNESNRILKASTGAAQLSRTQYKEGAVNFLDVIDADRTVLQSQRAAAQLAGLQAVSTVNLIRALGGGWSTAPAP
jgi:hypothetical protein